MDHLQESSQKQVTYIIETTFQCPFRNPVRWKEIDHGSLVTRFIFYLTQKVIFYVTEFLVDRKNEMIFLELDIRLKLMRMGILRKKRSS